MKLLINEGTFTTSTPAIFSCRNLKRWKAEDFAYDEVFGAPIWLAAESRR